MNDIPDATTVAFFRERLRNANVIDELFEMFESYIRDQGLEARGGQIIDAILFLSQGRAIAGEKAQRD